MKEKVRYFDFPRMYVQKFRYSHSRAFAYCTKYDLIKCYLNKSYLVYFIVSEFKYVLLDNICKFQYCEFRYSLFEEYFYSFVGFI